MSDRSDEYDKVGDVESKHRMSPPTSTRPAFMCWLDCIISMARSIAKPFAMPPRSIRAVASDLVAKLVVLVLTVVVVLVKGLVLVVVLLVDVSVNAFQFD